MTKIKTAVIWFFISMFTSVFSIIFLFAWETYLTGKGKRPQVLNDETAVLSLICILGAGVGMLIYTELAYA